MRCAWQAFINLLPMWMRESVDDLGREHLQELRLRLNSPPIMQLSTGQIILKQNTTIDDLKFCVNMASRYSPWAAETLNQCYITSAGGHRLGICGISIIKNGEFAGVRNLTSLCIRIARDFPGIANNLNQSDRSILILGQPGSGKTTLLRDMIRQESDRYNQRISVLDERQEIFPISNNEYCFPVGKNTDILSGCKKDIGIEFLLRNMGPDIIAIDEITAEHDSDALLRAGWCGVRLFATAHAKSKEDLYRRPIYKTILESGLFETLIVMHKDKSWNIEVA